MRRLVCTLAALALAATLTTPSASDSIGTLIAVEATPVALDPADPSRRRVGGLVFRGGLDLTSSDPRFGGISALLVLARGRNFLALSDQGYWINGAFEYDGAGGLAGVSSVSMEPILGPAGQWLTTPPWRDAESLALWEDGGVVVAFEDAHRLWIYNARSARPERLPPPPGLFRAPRNNGVEAITLLPGGRLFAVSEGLDLEDGVAGWVFEPDGTWSRFAYAVDGGFRPTGAATLDDGSVLVLERRFPPIGVRVRRIDAVALAADALGPDALVVAHEIATLDSPFTVDNMEAIDVRYGDDGRTFVYLVSDNNYSILQRTLVMMFELVDEGPDAALGAAPDPAAGGGSRPGLPVAPAHAEDG